MKHPHIDIKRLIIFVLLAATATTVASLTVGRDIYYGTRGHGLGSFAIVSLAGSSGFDHPVLVKVHFL